ncbi:ABC transporter ATP-binding protein [Teredinibacter purpureus]|uniref:ABC transporter ATP-binding protein n=1 Tax=Teredinibacter purpureus TaxID=2731756 RepID=UPI0005F88F59|nr:ABC transporter ATP-binding protein [Teredinibacter purpureus]
MLKLDHITLAYDKAAVVKKISLHINKGETACLIGPSGSGKSTILRAIAGFQQLDSGSIQLRGKTVSDKHTLVEPEHRKFSMVFQDYALFPHLNVEENVRFGLRKLSAADAKKKAIEMLELVGLRQNANRYCHQLSGGQQQRVAIARALAPDPDLLLLDEPFSNLDADLRSQLSSELRTILRDRNITTLMVTHDQAEAFCMADNLGVIMDGVLQQWDKPEKVYAQPVSRKIANFVGEGTYIPGHVTEDGHVETCLGKHACFKHTFTTAENVHVLIRPEMISFNPHSSNEARIVEKEFRGADSRYTVELSSGLTLRTVSANHLDFAIGESHGISLHKQPVTLLR